MATFRERDVFEYCENLFEKLKKEDGGYYPHKHDRLAFEQTAAHFSIGEENVRKIYDSYTKLAAQMEMLKIRRMPKKKQQAAMMRKMQDIVLNNRDLPFYKKEGEPSSPIFPATITIEEELKEPVSNIANAGWTIPLTIDVEQLSELTSCCDCQHIDSFFEKFYTDSKIRELYDIILPSIDNIGQRKRFEECYSMFEQGMYSSCLTVLTTIFEGMQNTAAALRRGTSALPAVPYVHHALRQHGQRAFLLYLPAQRMLECPAGYEKRGDCWAVGTARRLPAGAAAVPAPAFLPVPAGGFSACVLAHPLLDSGVRCADPFERAAHSGKAVFRHRARKCGSLHLWSDYPAPRRHGSCAG